MRTVLALLLVALVLPACNKNAPKLPPQVAGAKYGADILHAVRVGQETVMTLAKTQPNVMTPQLSDKIMNGIEHQLMPVVDRLRAALVTLDAATSLDFKKLQAAEVDKLAKEVAALATSVFKVEGTPQFVSSVADLGLDVVNLVRALQVEMERIRNGS